MAHYLNMFVERASVISECPYTTLLCSYVSDHCVMVELALYHHFFK